MEEKVIIRGSYSNAYKWLPFVIAIIGLVLIYIGFADGDLGRGAGAEYGVMFALGIALVIIAIILVCYISKCEIVVTEKRVYGKAAFGKRVDLPTDSISAVATSMFNGIAVASSSGKIVFLGIKNAPEIHKAISELLIQRQEKNGFVTPTTAMQGTPQSNADELIKYKVLLDNGTISPDEFEAKKKQLLGL